MTLSVIMVLYVCIGLMSAAGSIAISQKVFSPKAEQIFFGLFLVAIASFYLAFTAHFDNEAAWRLETSAVVVFAVLDVLGTRVSVLLILGYVLHGLWDLLHELHAHAGVWRRTSTRGVGHGGWPRRRHDDDWTLTIHGDKRNGPS